MFAEEINDEKPIEKQPESTEPADSKEVSEPEEKAVKDEKVETESKPEDAENTRDSEKETKEPVKIKKKSGRLEKPRVDNRKHIERRGSFRQGIRREEYRNRPYDALPARDQNINEILQTGNPDVINRTAEDYGKTWGDRPPWVKNRFSTFQIRPIVSKIQRIKKGEFDAESVSELKLLKPMIAYIARRYHDDDLYEFARIVRFGIDAVGDNPQKFKNFYSFFEALILFFRANGGK